MKTIDLKFSKSMRASVHDHSPILEFIYQFVCTYALERHARTAIDRRCNVPEAEVGA